VSIISGFFLPRKIAASAIQPRPLEIPGTKDEILNVKNIPAMLQKVPASVHDKILSTLGFTPLAVSTSLSVPVILKYSPILVLDKNKTESTTINPVIRIVRIFVVFTSKL